MTNSRKLTGIALALATAIGSIGAASAQSLPLFDPDGTQVGNIYQENQWENYGVWASDELQVRFYVEFAETEVRRGYWVGYDSSAETCNATAGDHLGAQLYTWGYLELRSNPNNLDQVEFTIGNCDGPPVTTLRTAR